MTYHVEYADSFTDDLDQHLAYLVRERVGVRTINGWFGRLYELVQHLDEMPKRHPLDGVYSEMTGKPTRKMNFGNYLVFYQVDDNRRRVDVVAFTHESTRREE